MIKIAKKRKIKATKGSKWETSKGETETWDVLKSKKEGSKGLKKRPPKKTKQKEKYLVSLKRERELAEKGWKVNRTESYTDKPKKAIGKKGYPYAILNKNKTYETFYTWKEKTSGKKTLKTVGGIGYTSVGKVKGKKIQELSKKGKRPIASGKGRKRRLYVQTSKLDKPPKKPMGKTIKELEEKMGTEKLKKLKVHYEMGPGTTKKEQERKKSEKPKKPMKKIIEELRKPPKPSGKTYIKGIVKEQKEYKKIEQKEQKKLDKSPKKTLFKKPEHKKYAEMISFKNPTQARISSRKLRKEFRESKQNAKQLRIARATQYASNRAKASGKRKKLSINERKQIKEIGKIYGNTAKSMWEKYKK